MMKNLKLSFFREVSSEEITTPISNYLTNFPWENYDFNQISKNPTELIILCDKLDRYFNDNTIKRIQLINSVIYGGYNNPGICVDRELKHLIKVGFIPICIWFNDPYIPMSKGCFCWDV